MQVRILRASSKYKFGPRGAKKGRPLSEQFGENYHCFPVGQKGGAIRKDDLPPEFIFFRGDHMLHSHYCLGHKSTLARDKDSQFIMRE